MLLVLSTACSLEDGRPLPTARDRFRPDAAWGVRLPEGRPHFGGDTLGEVVPLAGGRWATWDAKDKAWTVWDPAAGAIGGADGFFRSSGHCGFGGVHLERGVPTPDGSWLVAEHQAPRRMDTMRHASGVAVLPSGTVAWGPEVAAYVDRSRNPARSPDGTLPDREPTGGLTGDPSARGERWSADGARIVRLASTGVRVFDRSGRVLGAWDGEARGLTPAAAAPSGDGRLVVLSDREGRVAGWHVDEDRFWITSFVVPAHAAPTDDGSLVVATAWGAQAVLAAADGARLDPPRAEPEPPPRGDRGRAPARRQEERPPAVPAEATWSAGAVVDLAVSADGRAVAAATETGTILRFSPSDAEPRVLAEALGPGASVAFADDRVVVRARGELVAVLEPDGSGVVRVSRRRGLEVDDEGTVHLLDRDGVWAIAADGRVARLGPLVVDGSWSPLLDGARWSAPGRVGFPAGARVHPAARGVGCSTVARSPEAPAEPRGLAWIAPAPDGRWVIGGHQRDLVARGPDGAEETLPGAGVAAWRSPTVAVVAGPHLVGTWEMGRPPRTLRSVIARAPLATAAGGARQARLFYDALLVGPAGSDDVDCVLPGGRGHVVLSPSGRFVAWTDDDHQPWVADVDGCEVVRRPTPVPRVPPDQGARVVEPWSETLASSDDETWTVVRDLSDDARVERRHVDVAEGTRIPGEPGGTVVVDRDGLVAWSREGALRWWTPEAGLRELRGALRVAALETHPRGGVVVAGGGVVRVLPSAALERASVPVR